MKMNRLQDIIKEKSTYINEMFNNMKSDVNKPKESIKGTLEKGEHFDKRLSEFKITIKDMQKKIDDSRNLGDTDNEEDKKDIKDMSNVNNVLPIIVKSQTPLTISKISSQAPDTYNSRHPEKQDEIIRRHFSELWDDFDAVNDSYARDKENKTNKAIKDIRKDEVHESKDKQEIYEKPDQTQQSDAEFTDLIDSNDASDLFDTSDTSSNLTEKQKEFELILDPLPANLSSNTIDIKIEKNKEFHSNKYINLFNDLYMNNPYNSVCDEQKSQANSNQDMLYNNDPLHLIDSDMD